MIGQKTPIIFLLLMITWISPAQLLGQSAETIEIQSYQQYILVPVHINGQEKTNWFIFDTGATATVIDSAFAVSLGIVSNQQTQATGAGGNKVYQLATNQSIQITANKSLQSINLLLVDLSELQKKIGTPFAGIIGNDLLQEYIVSLDQDQKTMRLSKQKNDFDYTGYTPFSIQFRNNIPIPQFEIGIRLKTGEKLKGAIFFDSGAKLSLSINTPFQQLHQLEDKIGPTLETSGQTLTKASISKTALIDSLFIGDFNFGQVYISLANETAGVSAFKGYLGLLGMEVIQRFNFILDYQKKKLYLKPNQQYSKDFEAPLSGLRLIQQTDGIYIHMVAQNTPAQQLGFKVGQKILSIDDYTGQDLETMYGLLKKEGTSVKMVVQNAQKENVTMYLPLKKLL